MKRGYLEISVATLFVSMAGCSQERVTPLSEALNAFYQRQEIKTAIERDQMPNGYRNFFPSSEIPIIGRRPDPHALITEIGGKQYTFYDGRYICVSKGYTGTVSDSLEKALIEARRGPLVLGNNGFLSTRLKDAMTSLDGFYGTVVSIEDTPNVDENVNKLVHAVQEGKPIITIGHSAGCRDINYLVIKARDACQKMHLPPFVIYAHIIIEPTYLESAVPQDKHTPKEVKNLICLLSSEPGVLSGRYIKVSDLESDHTYAYNFMLAEKDHEKAPRDPNLKRFVKIVCYAAINDYDLSEYLQPWRVKE